MARTVLFLQFTLTDLFFRGQTIKTKTNTTMKRQILLLGSGNSFLSFIRFIYNLAYLPDKEPNEKRAGMAD